MHECKVQYFTSSTSRFYILLKKFKDEKEYDKSSTTSRYSLIVVYEKSSRLEGKILHFLRRYTMNLYTIHVCIKEGKINAKQSIVDETSAPDYQQVFFLLPLSVSHFSIFLYEYDAMYPTNQRV